MMVEDLNNRDHTISLIRHLYTQGNYTKLQIAIDMALARFPEDITLRMYHARIAMAEHDWDQAIQRWRYIICQKKNVPVDVFVELATAYYRIGDFQSAKNVLVEYNADYQGDHQALINLQTLVDSQLARKLEVQFTTKPCELRYNIGSINKQERIASREYFQSYKLRGWIKLDKDVSAYLILKQNGKVKRLPFNEKRRDVVKHFRRRNETAYIYCGFNHNVDLSKGGDIGFVVSDKIYWVLSSSIKELKGVVEGQNGWLFLANDTNKSIEQFTGAVRLSTNAKNEWEAFSKRLTNYQKNFHFVYFIVNSKEKVVPEFYPYKMNDQTVTEEVQNIFDGTGVRYLNPVLSMKRQKESYYRTDTHWSDLGAYIGFSDCMKYLGFYDIPKVTDFMEIEVIGDLGSKLDPPRRSMKKVHRFSGGTVRQVFSNQLRGTGSVRVWTTSNAPYANTVLLFGGSSLLSGGFCKYFCYSFQRVVAVNLPGCIVDEVVDAESPDVIIIQTNERYLLTPGKVYKTFAESPLMKRLLRVDEEERALVENAVSKYKEERFWFNKTNEAIARRVLTS